MAAAAQDPVPRFDDAPEPKRRRRSHRESRRRRQKRILKQALILVRGRMWTIRGLYLLSLVGSNVRLAWSQSGKADHILHKLRSIHGI